MKNPPKKLSAAIRLALQDLAKVEKDKKYLVSMETWHTPGTILKNEVKRDVCHVCFAGSVMAKSLGTMPSQYKNWFGFGGPWPTIFVALNRARQGDIGAALRIWTNQCINATPRGVEEEYDVVDYDANPKLFRKQMFKIARDLEGARL